MRVLFIGDVVGSPGRRGLRETMPALRERHAPDLVIVNGENSAGGIGHHRAHRQRPLRRRRRRDHHRQPRLPPPRGLRLPRPRASGWCGRPTTRRPTPAAATPWSRPAAMRVGGDQPQRRRRSAVARSPFDTVDGILDQIEADAVIVDFHAEVTSEKVAMGWHLDGRVAAVLRDPHPRADRRRPGAAAGHRLHLRRRHDRLADQRARGQARAGAGLDDHADADPVRDGRGGRLGDGGRGRGQRAGSG